MGTRRTYDQINQSQIAALCIMTIFPTLILMIPSILLRENGKDALWVMLVATLFGLGTGGIIGGMYQQFPQKRVTQICFIVFGRWLGGLFCIFYLLTVFGALISIFRQFGELSSWAFAFGDIPVEVFLLMGLMLAFMMSASGIESIARMSQLLLPVSILIIAFILIASIPWMNWRFLLPLIPQFRIEIITMAIHPAAFFSEALLIAMFFPHIRTNKGISRAMITAMLVIGGIGLITIMGLIAFFGGVLGGNLIFPLLHLSKTLRYGTFISHLQILIVPFLISAIAIKLAIFLHVVSLGLKDLFHLQGYRLASFGSAAAASLLAAILFDNPADLVHFITRYLTLFGSPLFFILSLLPYAVAKLFPHRVQIRGYRA